MKTKLLITALIASIAANVVTYSGFSYQDAELQAEKASRQEIQAELIDTVLRLYDAREETSELLDVIQQLEQAADNAPTYEYLGEFEITAYCSEKYPHICGTGDGITSTGILAAPGIVAVDPAVIPIGSTVYICGVPYLAADTGGKVKGNKVDICVSTHKEAEGYALQRHDVYLKKGG